MSRERLAGPVLIALALLGCGDSGQPSAPRGPLIKISTQSPLTGPSASLGEAIKLGAQLAIETLRGPIEEAGFKVQLVPFDDRDEAPLGVANAHKIVADPDILLVIGHLTSRVAIPAIEIYQQADLAMISPANTRPDITDSGHRNVNRVVGRDDVQGGVAAEFARQDLRATSAYVVHDGTRYGQDAALSFRAAAERMGIRVFAVHIAEARADYSFIIGKITQQSPDVVYFGGIYEDAAVFFSEARAEGVRAAFLGPDGMDSADLTGEAGNAVVGLHYTTVTGPVTVHPEAREFAASYRNRFGKHPEPFAAEAYDATLVGPKALERAIRDAGGQRPTREAVSGAIRQLRDVQGVTGPIEFDEKGDRRQARYFIMRVQSPQPELWHLNRHVRTIEAPPSSTRP